MTVKVAKERDSMIGMRADNIQAVAMEMDRENDSDSVADNDSQKSKLYSLQEVTDFLDETFSKFVDIVKFIQSVSTHQKTAGADKLDERKIYILSKHVPM